MTKVVLLKQLQGFTADAVKDLLLPVAMQKGDAEEPKLRAPEVFCGRLPESSAAKKKAPYIIHQVLTGKDDQQSGERPQSNAVVRSIFCVYHPDEQEGSLALLNVMERLRIALWETGVIGKQFTLDREAGLESLTYPDDTAPYYAGEMISTWKLPPIERKVPNGTKNNWNGAGIE